MNKLIQWIVLGMLTLVLFTLVDPLMYWMPSMSQMIALSLSAGLLAVMSGLVIAEKGGDEREVTHRMLAGRAGYIAGIAILTTALVYQGISHAIDIWVPLALLGMVFAKLLARSYSERIN